MRYETCPSECAAMNHPGEEHEARVISDEAVEAAAKVMQAKDVREGFGEYPLWEYTEDVKALLEAAAPHIATQAWDEGYAAGANDETNSCWGPAVTTTNPYRGQA